MASRSWSRPELVAGLATVGRDLAGVGGKAANLGELVRAGLPVPDGVVVGTGAYAAVVESAGLAAVIAHDLASDGDGASIRAAFEAVEVPEELRAEIVAAYAELGAGPVAVRSSATAEDLPGAAFAGQHDTYLHVVGEDAVLDAVRRCWGSLWTERAIAYRRRQGIGHDEVAIAVIIQRMVEAEFAGVMFTANPVTGERGEVVVEATSGLGEAVVSGLVTPDHFVLDAHGAILERTLGRREVVIRGATGGGTTHTTTLGEVQPPPDTVLVELAALGRSAAAHFGRPQDIEWAYADGKVWIVQSRPMTALPPAPQRLGKLQRAFAVQLMDYIAIRPYPLDISAWISPGIGRMIRRMLGENIGLRLEIAEMLPEPDGVVERFVPVLPRPTVGTLAAPARLVRRSRRFNPARWTDDPRFARFLRAVGDLGRVDVADVDWAGLVCVPRRALAALESLTELRIDYLPSVVVGLARLRLVLVVLRRVELFPLLLAGRRTRTDDTNDGLEGLAVRVREDPRLREAFARLGPPALLDRIAHDARFAGFADAFDEFLGEYGHRETTTPFLMSEPTWGDAPATVLGLIAALVDKPDPVAGSDRGAVALSRLLDHPLVTRTRSARAVLRVVEAARDGVAAREDTHFYATAVLPAMRRAALECGRRLTEAGALRDARDVLHLRLEELERIADPADLSTAEIERLRAAVQQRSARRHELDDVPLMPVRELFPPGDAGDALVTGVGVSGGRATGPVRVIHGPHEFATLRSGDVLVCPYTNPAWTPLFQRAAAVVADSGGLGSHAAIVAREYGIPAVMATVNATAVLADGQPVTVDGTTGRVTAAEP